MKMINKGTAPNSLVEHRTREGGTYDNYSDKQAIRACLEREQRGICCYCMSRIKPTPAKMKIEHWKSQSAYAAHQLDYNNLLGACKGGEGQAENKQYCDTCKKNKALSKNPANPLHQIENFIHYKGDGTIFSNNEAFDKELNEVLNLNVAFLVSNRKAVLDSFKMILTKKRGTLQKATLEKWLKEWSGEANTGTLKPYCQVIVYWLKKRLKRA